MSFVICLTDDKAIGREIGHGSAKVSVLERRGFAIVVSNRRHDLDRRGHIGVLCEVDRGDQYLRPVQWEQRYRARDTAASGAATIIAVISQRPMISSEPWRACRHR